MPVAIILFDGGIMPAIIHEDTDTALLQRLRTLEGDLDFADVDTAARALATRPDPSGWFESIEHANAYLDRMGQNADMTGAEIRAGREEMGLSRADLATHLGIGGNPNTQHKTLFDIERGKSQLNPQRTRMLRALLAKHTLGAATADQPTD